MISEIAFRNSYLEDRMNAYVVHMITQLKQHEGSQLEMTLIRIWEKCSQHEYRIAFANPSYAFLPLLKHFLLIQTDQNILRACLGCLWYLSRAHELRPIIANPSLGLIPLLLPFLINQHHFCEVTIKILSNCAIHEENHRYLLSSEINFLFHLKQLYLLAEDFERYPIQAVHCINCSLDSKYVLQFIQYNIPFLIVQHLLRAGANPLRWFHRGSGSCYFALNFLCNLSHHQCMMDYLRTIPHLYEYSQQVMKVDAMEGLKAMILFVNVYGSEEVSSCPNFVAIMLETLKKKAYIDRLQLSFDILVQGFFIDPRDQRSFQRLTFHKYAYGVIRMRCIFAMFRNLCAWEDILHYLLTEESFPFYFDILNHALEQFIINAPEPSMYFEIAREFTGGGGKDYYVAEYILQAILYIGQRIQKAQQLHYSVGSNGTHQESVAIEERENAELELYVIQQSYLRIERLIQLLNQLVNLQNASDNVNDKDSGTHRMIPNSIFQYAQIGKCLFEESRRLIS